MSQRSNIAAEELLIGASMGLVVSWMLLTFGVTSLFDNPPADTSDNSPLIPYLSAFFLLSFVAFRARRVAAVLGRSMPLQIACTLTAGLGGLVMAMDTLATVGVGIVLAALGSTVLVCAWSVCYGRLSAQQVEHVVLFGVLAAALGLMGLLWVPEHLRFALAQAIPLIAALLACAANRSERPGASHEGRRPEFAGARPPWTWKMRGAMVGGLGGAAFLCYLLLPVVTEGRSGGAYLLSASAIGFGCLLALAAAALLFRFALAINPATVFAVVAPLVGLAVLLAANPAFLTASAALVVALMIMLPQLLWSCLSKTAFMDPDDPVHYFLGGNAIYLGGSVLGTWLYLAFSHQIHDDPAVFQMMLHFVAFAALGLGSFMILGEPTGRHFEDLSPYLVSASGNPQLSQDELDRAAVVSIGERFGLSDREREIMAYVARGRSTPYIRDKLFVSANTVNSHIRRIYKKTGTHSRQEVIDLFERERAGL